MSWLLGGFLVCLGALSGAFGTVAWLTVLCATSLPQMLLGVLGLGVAPVVGGGALLWTGLGLLEAHAARSRILALDEGQLAEAARGGATASLVARRVGTGDVPELTRRLDELVARDVLALDISDEGELVYRPRASL
jgi:hypothetical protein